MTFWAGVYMATGLMPLVPSAKKQRVLRMLLPTHERRAVQNLHQTGESLSG